MSDAAVTYGAVGATQAPDLLRFPPAGFRAIERSGRLGSGESRFRAAVESLMTWGVQRGSGMRVEDIRAGGADGYRGIVLDADGQPAREQRHPVEEALFAADGTPYITAGTTAVVRTSVGPVRIDAPVRVVYVLDEPGLVGFAYGSLPGHPVTGEEAFVVEHRSDDSVWLTVRAFSRPDRWYLRLAGPVTRRIQSRATDRYLRALLPGRTAQDA